MKKSRPRGVKTFPKGHVVSDTEEGLSKVMLLLLPGLLFAEFVKMMSR